MLKKYEKVFRFSFNLANMALYTNVYSNTFTYTQSAMFNIYTTPWE